MKFIILIILMTNFSFATARYSSEMSRMPSEKELALSRSCFEEMEELGCGHPRKGTEEFKNCLAIRREHLRQSCQMFFNKLYGEK